MPQSNDPNAYPKKFYSKGYIHINRSLTAKQYAFVREYMDTDGNIRQAALNAGYSVKYAAAQGAQLMRNPVVKKEIDNYIKTIERKHEITFEWKINKLKNIIELCADKKATSHKDINPTAAIAAISELNKMQGHYSAEKHVNTNINIDTDLDAAKEYIEELQLKYKREY